MIDYKDEILAEEACYRLLDENKNVIHNKVYIEMIAKVLQAGTPLNKAFFDSIVNAINDVRAKMLPIKRYLEPTHNFETNTYVKTYEKSCIGVDCTATETGTASKTGMLEWSDSSTMATNLYKEQYTLVTLSKAIIIKKISFTCAANSSSIGTGTFKVEVSEDGNKFINIFTGSRTSDTYVRFNIDMSDNQTAYKYIRITRTDSNQYLLNFREFAILEAEKTDNVKNILNLSIDFEALPNQRMMVIIPNEYDNTLPTSINFDNMNISVNGELFANKKYELVYENDSIVPIQINENINTEIENIKNAIKALGGSI